MAFSATTVWEIQTGGADDYSAVSAVVAVGGSGYAVADVLTVSGGTNTTPATFVVATAPGGVVATVTPVQPGHYTVLPANAVATAVAPAGGTGCTLTITWNSGGNGGGFDHGVGGFPTDGAATVANTSAPVFTSASYTFVAGDVGAILYLKAGTSCVFGRYPIASVSGGAATLNAAAGGTPIGGSATPALMAPLTVAGIATIASPSTITWGIDYSQQASAQMAFTDMVIDGTTNTKFTSAGNPVGKNFIGNVISVNSGTGFTVQRVTIASTVTTTATCDKSLGTLSSTGGTGRLGGAMASLAAAYATAYTGGGGSAFNGMVCFVKNGTYSQITNTASVPQGQIAGGSTTAIAQGYSTNRYVGSVDTRPIVQVSGSTFTMVGGGHFFNVTFDGNSQTAAKLSTGGMFIGCSFTNFTAASTGATYVGCVATGCSVATFTGTSLFCEAYGNTATPFTSGAYSCLSYNNTGASTDGFTVVTGFSTANCVAYGNGRDGFRGGNGNDFYLINCHAEGNAGVGYNVSVRGLGTINCSAYLNTGGSGLSTGTSFAINPLTPSGSVFTSPAGNDFSLNALASQGALLRAQGYAGLVKNIFPRGASSSYLDVGPIQHADPVVLLRNQGMDGGLNG